MYRLIDGYPYLDPLEGTIIDEHGTFMKYFGHRYTRASYSSAKISSTHTMMELLEEQDIKAILREARFTQIITI